MIKIFNITAILLFVSCSTLYARNENVLQNLKEFYEKDNNEIDYERIEQDLWNNVYSQPYNYENYGHLAFFYDYIGDYENELSVMKKGVAYLPEDADEKDIYYGNLARAYMQNGLWKQGKEWLDKADVVNSDNYYNRWNAFDYYVRYEKNYSAAALELKLLDKMLNEEDHDVYFEAYKKVTEVINDDSEIVRLFRESVNIDPDNYKSRRVLGIAIRNVSLNDYEKIFPLVMEELMKAYEMNPKYLPTLITIAYAHLYLELISKKTGGYANALEWLDKAQLIEPDNLNLAQVYGVLFNQMQLYDKAIEKLEFAYLENSEDSSIKNYLAIAYNGKAYECYESGECLDAGLLLIDKAIDLKPGNGIILSTKAELLYKLGRFEEAFEIIKKGIELEPDHDEIKKDFVMIKSALESK